MAANSSPVAKTLTKFSNLEAKSTWELLPPPPPPTPPILFDNPLCPVLIIYIIEELKNIIYISFNFEYCYIIFQIEMLMSNYYYLDVRDYHIYQLI